MKTALEAGFFTGISLILAGLWGYDVRIAAITGGTIMATLCYWAYQNA